MCNAGSSGNSPSPDLQHASELLARAIAVQALGLAKVEGLNQPGAKEAEEAASDKTASGGLEAAVQRLESKVEESNRLAQLQMVQQALLMARSSATSYDVVRDEDFDGTSLEDDDRLCMAVADIMQAFMQGYGKVLCRLHYFEDLSPSESRTRLSEWIHVHTGQRPRFEMEEMHGKEVWTIHRV